MARFSCQVESTAPPRHMGGEIIVGRPSESDREKSHGNRINLLRTSRLPSTPSPRVKMLDGLGRQFISLAPVTQPN
jgi:hypothetical protein